MCGIAASYGHADVDAALDAIAHRGPDARGFLTRGEVTLGHVRLAILDLDHRSDQPFTYGRTTVSYNGECWNHRQVRADLERLGHTFATSGDTEVVAAALDEWGTDALPRLNGMFAVAWTDGDALWAARDRYGEVPLHAARRHAGVTVVSSELRGVEAMTGSPSAIWVEPGEVMRIDASGITRSRWYACPAAAEPLEQKQAQDRLRDLVALGCRERAISDVPVCTLLSGGVDSSAIAYHLREHVPGLVAFTAVLEADSRDARNARDVAAALDLELVEVPVSVPTGADLSAVVDAIEMPFKAQVEIGWACLALARAMQERGFKVVFSGEGSDELWGSYGFTYHAMGQPGYDWHRYRRDLFLGQHRKNFARCNKVFLRHGVECRLPFLHPPLVEFALSVPADLCYDRRPVEKRLIRQAYDGLLPGDVIRRPKEAFQDGLGLKQLIAETVDDPRGLYRRAFSTRFVGASA